MICNDGYLGTPHTLKAVSEDPDSRDNLGAAAHLIHGSSEGRFSITYCPGKGTENLTRKEIESVGFQWGDIDETMQRYDISHLKEGFNTLPERKFTTSPARHSDYGRTGIGLKIKKWYLVFFGFL